MIFNLEWRIPWPVDWDADRKRKAAEKLASYINDGTMFDVDRRMQATAEAKFNLTEDGKTSEASAPYISIRLEK